MGREETPGRRRSAGGERKVEVASKRQTKGVGVIATGAPRGAPGDYLHTRLLRVWGLTAS
jgi:hypothetical protein